MVDETLPAPVEAVETAGGADPEHTGVIDQQGPHEIADETVGLRRVMAEDLDLVAVEPVQPTLCRTEPEEALLILFDRAHIGVREPLCLGDMHEGRFRTRRRGVQQRAVQQKSRTQHQPAQEIRSRAQDEMSRERSPTMSHRLSTPNPNPE